MLPAHFTPKELFMAVAGLSYTGDPRMAMAEHPDKVQNIVTGPGQLEAFFKMYSPFLPHIQVDGNLSSRTWSQDDSPQARAELARKMPVTLREMLFSQFVARKVVEPLSTRKGSSDPEELKADWAKIVTHEDFPQAMGQCKLSLTLQSTLLHRASSNAWPFLFNKSQAFKELLDRPHSGRASKVPSQWDQSRVQNTSGQRSRCVKHDSNS